MTLYDAQFEQFKTDEDKLRAIYCQQDDRPDKENPVYGLIKLDNQVQEILRQKAIKALKSNLVRAGQHLVPSKEILQLSIDELTKAKDVKTIPWFYEFVNELPEDLSRHICIAGGSPLNMILSGYHADPGRAIHRDVDVFIVGPEDPIDVTKQLFAHIEETPDLDISSALRTLHCVGLNLCKDMEDKLEVQIILRNCLSPSEVVTGFELDASGVCYYQGSFYCTPRAYFAIENMTQRVDVDRISTAYEYRLAKYSQRGFAVQIPSRYDLSQVQIPDKLTDRDKLTDQEEFMTYSPLVRLIYMMKNAGYGKVSDYVNQPLFSIELTHGNYKIYLLKGRDEPFYEKIIGYYVNPVDHCVMTEIPDLIWELPDAIKINDSPLTRQAYFETVSYTVNNDTTSADLCRWSFHRKNIDWPEWTGLQESSSRSHCAIN